MSRVIEILALIKDILSQDGETPKDVKKDEVAEFIVCTI